MQKPPIMFSFQVIALHHCVMVMRNRNQQIIIIIIIIIIVIIVIIIIIIIIIIIVVVLLLLLLIIAQMIPCVDCYCSRSCEISLPLLLALHVSLFGSPPPPAFC